jgi:hypothetical protein
MRSYQFLIFSVIFVSFFNFVSVLEGSSKRYDINDIEVPDSVILLAEDSCLNVNDSIFIKKKEQDSIEIYNVPNFDSINSLYNDSNSSIKTKIIGTIKVKVKRLFLIFLKIFFALLFTSLIYFVYIYNRDKNQKIYNLEQEISSLRNQLLKNDNQINYLKETLENLKKGKSPAEEFKSIEEIIYIRSKVVKEIENENKLSKEELLILLKDCDRRWITLGHSALGNSHAKSIPPIPCQDSFHVEILENGWILSIVCDGAGSAKLSHLGSEFLARTAIPLNLKSKLSKLSWYSSNHLPEKDVWFHVVLDVLSKSLEDLRKWIMESIYDAESEKEFASTVILSLHNCNGVLTANIGDGRGGYLNNRGEFRPLFEPFKGDEANSTVFITSPIWVKPNDFINVNVINEIPLSVFILSDGLEKVSFNCSKMVDGIWVDPNIPYRNFFYPILKKIKEIPQEHEFRLPDDWKNLLESGNELIKTENDDKTMVISFLK